mmetsp:Transcript_8783/g.24232  ORF Transcript_8783/g.24232 Transcript_8783/m.24232 type:complete len:231 (-) Transcript_8783:8-700(-)
MSARCGGCLTRAQGFRLCSSADSASRCGMQAMHSCHSCLGLRGIFNITVSFGISCGECKHRQSRLLHTTSAGRTRHRPLPAQFTIAPLISRGTIHTTPRRAVRAPRKQRGRQRWSNRFPRRCHRHTRHPAARCQTHRLPVLKHRRDREYHRLRSIHDLVSLRGSRTSRGPRSPAAWRLRCNGLIMGHANGCRDVTHARKQITVRRASRSGTDCLRQANTLISRRTRPVAN